MKIVIFTAKNHLYANEIIKGLLDLKALEVVAIVESDIIYPGTGKIRGLSKYLRISGFSYVLHQTIKVLFFQFGSLIYSLFPFKDKSHILFSYRLLAKRQNIPIIVEKNINRKEFINFLSSRSPDLFVSVLFNQLFKRKILSVPKKGVINFHPAPLPSYKGVSPVFWVLAKGEAKTGVTIHRIDSEKIDEGRILAQKEIPILSSDTEHSLYWRCVKEGMPLFNEVIEKIRKDKEFGIKYNKKIAPSYFSLPTKDAVYQLKKRGRKFFTLKELLT